MDEDSLTYALVPKPPPLEPREQLPPFFLNTVQLAKMVAWLQSAAPGGQVLLEVLVAVFHRAAALAGLKLLPAEWIPLPPSKLRALLVSYQTGDRPGFVPCVDWRRVMYSLANLPEPTVGQLQKLVAAVKSLGPQIESLEAVPRAMVKGLEMWFGLVAAPESSTDENGQTVLKGHQLPLLKEAVLDIFTNSSGNVNLLHLILYACGSTQVLGIEKALQVLGDGNVSKDALLPILSLVSLSCFSSGGSGADIELVDMAIAAALEGKEAGTVLSVAALMEHEKGLALVSSCPGLEAKSPHTMLSKL